MFDQILNPYDRDCHKIFADKWDKIGIKIGSAKKAGIEKATHFRVSTFNEVHKSSYSKQATLYKQDIKKQKLKINFYKEMRFFDYWRVAEKVIRKECLQSLFHFGWKIHWIRIGGYFYVFGWIWPRYTDTDKLSGWQATSSLVFCHALQQSFEKKTLSGFNVALHGWILEGVTEQQWDYDWYF